MAKANKRLRSVVEGAVEATKDARRAAAAAKIRAGVTPAADAPAKPATAKPPATPAAESPAATAPPPEKPAKPRRNRSKPQEPAVEPDTKLDASPEQRVPVDSAPAPSSPPPSMSPEDAQKLRDTMLGSRSRQRPAGDKPKSKPKSQKPAGSGGFAPIRGPGALLGRLLRETYRQAPNIAANAVAIPAFTAAGAGGIYLGTAGTVAAIRGIGKLLAPAQEQAEPAAANPPSVTPPPPDDYRAGFQRAIDQRRKPRATDSGTDVIRTLTRTRGVS